MEGFAIIVNINDNIFFRFLVSYFYAFWELNSFLCFLPLCYLGIHYFKYFIFNFQILVYIDWIVIIYFVSPKRIQMF